MIIALLSITPLSAQTPENPQVGSIDPFFDKEPTIFCDEYPHLCIQTQCEDAIRPPISTNPVRPYWLTGTPAGHYSLPTRFNWHAEKFRYYATNSAGGSSTEHVRSSPFFGENQIQLDHIREERSIRQDADLKTEDGWELLDRALGYDENEQLSDSRKIVYLLFYNRFTARVRILAASVSELTGVNSASFMVGFKPDEGTIKTAAFDLLTTELQPLEEGKETGVYYTEGMEGINTSVSAWHWYYAEIPVMYDPCTCTHSGNKQSNMFVKLVTKQTSQLTLKGNFEGNTTRISKPAATEESGAFSTFNRGVETVSKGVKITKQVASFLGDIEKLWSKKAQEATDAEKKRVLEAAGQKVTDGKSGFFSASNVRSFLKLGASAVPYLNVITAGLDFFSAGGKSASNDKAPIELAPMKIDASLTLTGTISVKTPDEGIDFSTPGSRPDARYKENPYYNEVLGVFHLVNQPKLKKFREIKNIERFNTSRTPVGKETVTGMMINYRFTEPLKYVLNPASGLEIQESEYSLVAYGDSAVETDPYFGSFSELSGFDELKKKFIYQTSYSKLENIGNDLIIAPEWWYVQGIGTTSWHKRQPTHIRIRLNLRRKDNGGQNVMLLYTFKIGVEEARNEFDKTPFFSQNGFIALDKNEIGDINNESEKTLCGSKKYKTGRIPTKKKESTSGSPFSNNISSFDVSPNPASDFINMKYEMEKAGTVNIYVTDLSGRMIEGTFINKNVEEGVQNMQLQLGSMVSGMYILHLEMNNEKQMKRFVVMK